MDVRFYIDPETEDFHCLRHNVTPLEAIQVLQRATRTVAGTNETWIAEGQTAGGRYLRVIYVDDDDGSKFVITAYDMTGSRKRSHKRKRRRK